MSEANPYNSTADPIVSNTSSFERYAYAKIAIVNTVCLLLGNYLFVAFIYVSSQLAEPDAIAIPKFWYKSLVRFPITSVIGVSIYLIPTMAAIAFAFTLISGKNGITTKRIWMFGCVALFLTFSMNCFLGAIVYQHRFDMLRTGFIFVFMLICFGIGTIIMTIRHIRNVRKNTLTT